MIRKDKLYIFFAASPLHLICINELRRYQNIDKFKLILILHKGNKLPLYQMDLTLKKLNLRENSIFWVPKIKFLRYLAEIILIINLKLISINKNLSFVLIDFRNIFMQSLRRFFNKSEFTLIDDGFYTFVAQQNFMSKNIFLPTTKYKNFYGKISKFIYYGNSYSRLKETPINLFTIYADEMNNNKAKMNKLNFLRKSFKNKNINILYEEVFFIGTQMAERGTLTLEQELDLVKTANNYWERQNIKMYYIGKRSTSKQKLELFKKNGIATRQYDLPLELVLSKEKAIPGNICTLGSTLQKSLSIIFENKINFYFINIKDFFDIKPEDNETIKMDEVDYFAAEYSEKSSRITTINLRNFL